MLYKASDDPAGPEQAIANPIVKAMVTSASGRDGLTITFHNATVLIDSMMFVSVGAAR